VIDEVEAEMLADDIDRANGSAQIIFWDIRHAQSRFRERACVLRSLAMAWPHLVWHPCCLDALCSD